jgi:hypothetical protein
VVSPRTRTAQENTDVAAATLVVGQDLSEADFLTVDQAVINLPSGGGRIAVLQGVYKPSATFTMPDAPVEIIGMGEATVFDLQKNSFPVFTIPDGLTSQHQYEFSGFKVISQTIFGSKILSIQDTGANGRVVMRQVRSEGVQVNIEITAGDVGFLTPVLVDVYDCWFVPSNTYFNAVGNPICSGCATLCTTGGGIFLNKVTMRNVNFMVDEFTATGGTINGDSFGGLDISLYNCMIAFAGEDGLNSIHAERCRIWDFTQSFAGAAGHFIFLGGLGFSADDTPESAFIDCNLLGLMFDDSGGFTGVGGWWTNCSVDTSLTNGHSTITGVTFRGDVTSAATFPLNGGLARFVFGDTEDVTITGCTFSSSGNVNGATAGPIDIYVDATSSLHLSNCEFRALTGGSTAGVRFSGHNNWIVASEFDNVWATPPVLEIAGTDFNTYDDTLGLNGGTGGTPSVFVGPNNVYNSSCLRSKTGATTDPFVSILPAGAQPLLNKGGLVGVGTIKNTGANDMVVKEIVTDAYGVTDNQTTTVLAGGDLLLDTLLGNVNTAKPPYVSYDIQVQSKVAGTPTTYNLKLTANPELTAF